MDFFTKIGTFFRQLWKLVVFQSHTRVDSIEIASERLQRKVHLDLYLPCEKNKVWSLLILNDGQDAKSLQLKKAHQKFDARQNTALMIVGIHAGSRMDEYGTAGCLADKGMGKNSLQYQEFVLKELLPYLHQRYPITADQARVAIAGCSLGGLSAIDLAWSWPKVFGIVGIFSGALWWRDKPFDPKLPDANRIMHRRVAQANPRNQRIWCMAGTHDETEDRNNNGIIDAIDDTLQLLKLMEQKVQSPEQNLKYLEVEGGEHHPKTWSKVLPIFLDWAFANVPK